MEKEDEGGKGKREKKKQQSRRIFEMAQGARRWSDLYTHTYISRIIYLDKVQSNPSLAYCTAHPRPLAPPNLPT